MTTQQSTTVTVTIDAPPARVLEDLADPRTHPEWGSEFFGGPLRDSEHGGLIANVPSMGGDVDYRVEARPDAGAIDISFAPPGGDFGPPLPVRLVPNGDGVDVLWTLQRPPGLPDDAWAGGIEAMGRELANLKRRHEEANVAS